MNTSRANSLLCTYTKLPCIIVAALITSGTWDQEEQHANTPSVNKVHMQKWRGGLTRTQDGNREAGKLEHKILCTCIHT